MTRHDALRPRRGFTLVELLVVIIIIAILMALLIPAIAGAMRQARSAAVQAEISQLAQALADFKSKFGDYPPSRILMQENGGTFPSSVTPVPTTANSNAVNDVTQGQLYQRTVTAFRKFWPRVPLGIGAAYWPAGSNTWYDFNGNGTFDSGSIYLQGNECLVFFLGGIAQPGPSSNILGMTGFAKNPTNPFLHSLAPTSGTNVMYSGNRNAPLFEFAPGRLRMNTATGMASYVDSLNATNNQAAAFYAYFSTNNGAGYDPNDVNASESDSNATSPITLTYLSNQTLSGGGKYTSSPSPNPYTSGQTAPFSASAGQGVGNVAYHNPQSFQIISSGVDGVFGLGGIYNSSTTSSSVLPAEDQTSALGTAFNTGTNLNLSNSTDGALRTVESDNLTNFHNGKLE